MTEKPKTVDFGAPDAFGIHLFRVVIRAARSDPVIIVEDYGYRGQEAGIAREEERVVLTYDSNTLGIAKMIDIIQRSVIFPSLRRAMGRTARPTSGQDTP